MQKQIRRLAEILCVLTLLAVCLPAQTVSSSLQGTVVDPANAVVPNAPITLTDTSTGAIRSAVTDATGLFRFLNLAPGTYSLTVKATGFKQFTQNNIVVAANETRDIARLELAIGNT